jgi:hypothetical protein
MKNGHVLNQKVRSRNHRRKCQKLNKDFNERKETAYFIAIIKYKMFSFFS